MKRIGIIFSMIVCAIMLSGVARCEIEDRPMPPPPGSPMESPSFRAKLESKIFKMISDRLSEEMKLPSDKNAKLMNVLRKHFKNRGELTKKKMDIFRWLQENTSGGGAKPTKGQLQAKLKSLNDVRKMEWTEENAMRTDVQKILSTEQMAKFEVTMPMVQGEIKQFIDRNRGKRQDDEPGMRKSWRKMRRSRGMSDEGPPDGPPPAPDNEP